jgi:hypothetical protein
MSQMQNGRKCNQEPAEEDCEWQRCIVKYATNDGEPGHVYGGGSGTWIMIRRLLDKMTYPTSHLPLFVSRQVSCLVNLRELLELISWMCRAFVLATERREDDVCRTYLPSRAVKTQA